MLIIPPTSPGIRVSVGLPGSKSIANRLLVMRSLARSGAGIRGLPDSDDTRQMQVLLEKIESTEYQSHDTSPVFLDCENAGTVFRFLTALLVFRPGIWLLSGSGRMKERPVGSLVEALRQAGADIRYQGRAGYPPLLIRGGGAVGGRVRLDATASSQYLSALLMVAPLMPGGLHIELMGEPVSFPYVDMTLGLLRDQGIAVEKKGSGFHVPHQNYPFRESAVEADWSAASYWYEIAALSGTAEIFLPGLSAMSLQGDRALGAIYASFGVQGIASEGGMLLRRNNLIVNEFIFDLRHHPDVVPAVAATMAGLGVQGRLHGLHHLRIKESDRLFSMQDALGSMGYAVSQSEDSLVFTPGYTPPAGIPLVKTRGDHRIALSAAPLSLKAGPVRLDDAGVVSKSYPTYWDDLQAAGFQLLEK